MSTPYGLFDGNIYFVSKCLIVIGINYFIIDYTFLSIIISLHPLISFEVCLSNPHDISTIISFKLHIPMDQLDGAVEYTDCLSIEE